jgi:uncharacterized protein
LASPALAEKPAQPKKAGVLHVYGNADTKLFSEDGIKQAESILQSIQFDHGLIVTVDTYPEVPANKRAEADAARGSEDNWHRFLNKWTKERASSDKSHGIYIVIVQKPIGGIAVVADRESRERGFSDDDEKHVWETIRTSFKDAAKRPDDAKKREARDSGLIASIDFIVKDLKDTHVPLSATTKNDSKKASMGVGGWICLVLCILLGVWLVIGIIRALTGGGGGYGGGGYGGGGGGFGSSLLGGLFGAMAGMWLYNSMFGGHHDMGSNDAFAGDGGGGGEGDTGAGDYSGEDGAAGGYDSGGDWGGGGDMGGGGGDWGGGGDFGGDF